MVVAHEIRVRSRSCQRVKGGRSVAGFTADAVGDGLALTRLL
jgi:hypothetical protein